MTLSKYIKMQVKRTSGHWKKGFDLLRRHFRQFLLTVVQPLPEDVTHLDETDQAGLHPGKVSGSVGERGQGLLHSLSLQVTILASTSAMTLLSLLGFSNGCKQG